MEHGQILKNLVYIDPCSFTVSLTIVILVIYREKLLQILLHTGIFGG